MNLSSCCSVVVSVIPTEKIMNLFGFCYVIDSVSVPSGKVTTILLCCCVVVVVSRVFPSGFRIAQLAWHKRIAGLYIYTHT